MALFENDADRSMDHIGFTICLLLYLLPFSKLSETLVEKRQFPWLPFNLHADFF